MSAPGSGRFQPLDDIMHPAFQRHIHAVHPSAAVAARLDAGGRLANLEDWRSGDTMRVMTTVAPFGGEVRL